MRILIVTNEHLYSNVALKDFIKKYNKQIIGIIDADFVVPGKSFLETTIFLFKKSTLLFCIYKFFEQKLYQFKTLLNLGNLKSFKSYSKKYNIPLYKTKNINENKTIDLINSLKPDVIYSVSFPQKLGKDVISMPQYGCINFHDSLLPAYRGLCAYFWIMANNEKESGVSAHFIDDELDSGKLILQKKIKINDKETMQHLYYRCSVLIKEMLPEIQNKLERKDIRPITQEKEGSYYSWPDRKGYSKFRKHKKRFFKFWELWNSI